VSTLSCPPDEAIEGYVLLSANSLLRLRGLIPLTTRYLALRGDASPSTVMLEVLRALVDAFPDAIDGADSDGDLAILERRLGLMSATFAQRTTPSASSTTS
jgi:hypothetical protein